jgi:hypothetical protein
MIDLGEVDPRVAARAVAAARLRASAQRRQDAADSARAIKFQLFQHLCPMATQTRLLLHDAVQGAIRSHNREVLSNLVEHYQVELFLRTVVKGIYWFGDSVDLCRCLARFFESVAAYEGELDVALRRDADTDVLLGISDRPVRVDYGSVCAIITRCYDLYVSDVLVPMNAHYSRLAANCSQQCHSLVILQMVLPVLVLPTREYAERALVSVQATESPLEYVLSTFVSRSSVQLYANYPFSLLLGRGAGEHAGVSAAKRGGSGAVATSHVDALNTSFRYLLSVYLLKVQLELRWISANKLGNSESFCNQLASRGGRGARSPTARSAQPTAGHGGPLSHRVMPTSQRVILYLLLQYINHIASCVLVHIHEGSCVSLWPVLRALSGDSSGEEAVAAAGVRTPSSSDEFTALVADCVRAVEDCTCIIHGYNADILRILVCGWRALRCGDNPELSEADRGAIFNECYASLTALYSNLKTRHSLAMLRTGGGSSGIGEDLLAILPQVT